MPRLKNFLRAIAITLCFAMGYSTLLHNSAWADDPDAAIEKLGAQYDSLYSSDLNAAPDSLAEGDEERATRSAQQIFEENPHYTMRQYDHKQQVIVGSVVMFCVTLAMVAMNNYNPKHD